MQVSQRVTIDGVTSEQLTSVVADNKVGSSAPVTAAKTGVVAVKTSASVGTLTLQASHGIVDADKIDIFWSGGQRRGCLVGTVSVNSVPITSGSGDDLPVATTVLTVMKPHEEVLVVTGNNVAGIHVVSPQKGFVVFTEAGGTVIKAIKIDDGGDAYFWFDDSAASNPMFGANPLAAATVGKVLTSHDDSTASHTPTISVFYN